MRRRYPDGALVALPHRWELTATNDLLCDAEGDMLARRVSDRQALALIRRHVEATGHRVFRQRTRYQLWVRMRSDPDRWREA